MFAMEIIQFPLPKRSKILRLRNFSHVDRVDAILFVFRNLFLGIFVRTPYGQPGPLRLNRVDSARTFSQVGRN